MIFTINNVFFQKYLWCVPALLLLSSLLSFAQDNQNNSVVQKGLFWNIDNHLSDGFIDNSSFVHLGAIGATWILIESGVDADVQEWSTQQDETFSIATSVPALAGGMFAPFVVPLSMYYFSDDPKVQQGAFAVGQAVLIASAANHILKAITGRSAPDAEKPLDTFKRSKEFKIGFLRSGVFNGWPSGHAMTNMAMASALANYFHDSPKIKFWTYAWATYVMVSVTIGMQGGVHWLSDCVAAGMMGWVIGKTVGESFAGQSNAAEGFSMSVSPAVFNQQGSGISLRFSF